MAGDPVEEPFPIYRLNNRYLLYDANVVSHVRATHHMCGVLSGTLPQIPQQNVFLGLPLQLMDEEAALLVEKGAAYIVSDATLHKHGLSTMQDSAKASLLTARELECLREASEHQRAAEERKAAFLKTPKSKSPEHEDPANENAGTENENGSESTDPLFGPSTSASTSSEKIVLPPDSLRFHPTATVSHPAYHSPSPSAADEALRPQPRKDSYALYKHLHANNYFLSPGLRFGCQFTAYPGDPLRFHSHFVVNGLGWDEEMEMRDIVGGGRLGTGVKKAWMVGGEDESGRVRTFCVEWGGF
ncbi:tRNA-splicing endonuclease subunit [Rhizina undulata]